MDDRQEPKPTRKPTWHLAPDGRVWFAPADECLVWMTLWADCEKCGLRFSPAAGMTVGCCRCKAMNETQFERSRTKPEGATEMAEHVAQKSELTPKRTGDGS